MKKSLDLSSFESLRALTIENVWYLENIKPLQRLKNLTAFSLWNSPALDNELLETLTSCPATAFDARVARVRSLHKKKAWEDCAEAASHALQMRESGDLYLYRGDTFLKLARYDDAIADFSAALSLPIRETDGKFFCIFNRAVGHERLGRHEVALRGFSEAAELKPKNASVYDALARNFSKLERFDEGIETCSKAIQLRLYESDAYNQRSFMYLAQKKPAAAVIDAERSLAVVTETKALLYFDRLVTKLSSGCAEDNVLDAEQVIEMQPSLAFLDSYNAMGVKAVEEARRFVMEVAEKSVVSKARQCWQRILGPFLSAGAANLQSLEHIDDDDLRLLLRGMDYVSAGVMRKNAYYGFITNRPFGASEDVASVRMCDYEVWCRALQRGLLREDQHITHLYLQGGAYACSALAHFPLERLWLEDCKLMNDPLPPLDKMTRLGIHGSVADYFEGTIVRLVRACRNLRALHLEFMWITQDLVEQFQSCPHLEELDLADCYLSMIDDWSWLLALPSLRKLRLSSDTDCDALPSEVLSHVEISKSS